MEPFDALPPERDDEEARHRYIAPPPSKMPTQKVAVGTAAGAFAVIVSWLLSLFGLDMAAGVEGAFVVLFSFVGGYLTPNE